jgi:integrase
MRPQSANRLMASIAYASRWWAHFANDASLDFALVQRARSKDKKPQAPLSAEEARQLLITCGTSPAGHRDFALIVVGLETGMRQVSLASMTIEDTLLEPGPRSPYPAAFVALKGKDPAWVPLSDASVIAIHLWLVALARLRVAADSGAADAGPLFRPLAHRVVRSARTQIAATRALSHTAIDDILNNHAKAAGLRRINPHLLRHTFVTWRERQGLQPQEIAAITHHDITKALGALGGYMNPREIGGSVRNRTPEWLAELVRARRELLGGLT